MKKTGFSLVEILVVITIIGVLTSIAAVSYSSLSKNSRDAKRRSDLEQIRAALEMYRSNSPTGIYPVAGDCTSLGAPLLSYLPQFPPDPKSGSSYNCSSSDYDYSLSSTLETGATNCPPASGDCGVSTPTCRYSVGPYGKTCGP